jgi:predicted ATP-grasp superfamily ATP-dependent carboligase
VLGPDDTTIELASDKHRTAEHLQAHGVAAPSGMPLEAGERPPRSFDYPAVWKRRDGAGSLDVRLLRTADEAELAEPHGVPSRLERFLPGLACSVAWLCGPNGRHPLPPCRQHLSNDGRFTYMGGSTPLPPPLATRAVELSRRAIQSLPHPRGYLGVDLVLGEDAEGRGNGVIEINPRLTTSYVGLRAICQGNLAQAMLDAANGRAQDLEFSSRRIEFSADGTVRPEEQVL